MVINETAAININPTSDLLRCPANENLSIFLVLRLSFLLSIKSSIVLFIAFSGEEKGLWGSYNHKEELDVMRFRVPVETTEVLYEPFTIEFLDKGLKKVQVALKWDRTMVRFPLEVIPEEDL